MKVILEDGSFVFNIPFHENHLAKACGARFHPSTKKWKVKSSELAASFVANHFPPKEIDPSIMAMVSTSTSVEIPELTTDLNEVLVDGVYLRNKQIEGIKKAWPLRSFAFFWVMGAGKTLSSITLANNRYKYGLIDRVIIVCPNSIKGVWAKEYASKSRILPALQVMEAGDTIQNFLIIDFPVLIVSTEGFSQGSGFDKAVSFCKGHRTMVILDESSSIKVHDSVRTEKLIELAGHCDYRLILTGTNVTQKLHDLWPQMGFLDKGIIGEISFYSFRNKYCVMGGFKNKQVIGYTNIETLYTKIRPYCHVVRKNEIEGLPPKIYEVRNVKATDEQKRFCKEIVREALASIEGEEVTAANALEMYLRMHQVSGGITPEGKKLSKNPKMVELLNVLEEHQGKAIIWAVYVPEMEMIRDALEKEYPGSTVMFYGGTRPEERQGMVDDFETSATKRFWISNKTGSRGLTLLSPNLTIYYSNSFNAEDRLQSEDRNHRIGQTQTIKYVDIVLDTKVDKRVQQAIEMKKSVYELVNESLGQYGVKDLF